MTGLHTFVMSVISAIMVTSILQLLVKDSCQKSWIQTLGGIYITVTLLMNIRGWSPDIWTESMQEGKDTAQYYMEAGKKQAWNRMRDIITANTEAYILDKAAQLGVSVTASVSVSDDDIPVPESVTLYGQIAPYERTTLCKIISEDLGIPREDQLWIG